MAQLESRTGRGRPDHYAEITDELFGRNNGFVPRVRRRLLGNITREVTVKVDSHHVEDPQGEVTLRATQTRRGMHSILATTNGRERFGASARSAEDAVFSAFYEKPGLIRAVLEVRRQRGSTPQR